MDAPLVQVREVTKDYRALRPLRLQEFDLHAGESVAFLGFDLAMAEVLVNMITGAILPDSGSITVFGQRTDTIANAELVHSRHVRMPQCRCCARFAHEAFPRFCAVRPAIGVDDFERDRTIERLIDRAIRNSHRAMAELPYTAIRMMLDRVSTQLIRRRNR